MTRNATTPELRPIPGWEGLYSASDDGRIWSHRRHRWLAEHVGRNGYASLKLARDGRARTHLVHRLVARAWHGEAPTARPYCCHSDGNKLNNRPSNLRWDTPAGNQADRVGHGTHTRGERHPSAKLTPAAVWEIRRRYAAGGVLHRQLAAEFGVSRRLIGMVVRGKSWTWLTQAGTIKANPAKTPR